MKNIKKSIIAGIAGTFLFSTGALAGGLYDDFMDRKKGEIDMAFGQMESSAIAQMTVEVEKYRDEDFKRVDKAVDDYRMEAMDGLGQQIFEVLMETEYKVQTEKIKKDHDKMAEELKAYVDQVADQYRQGYGIDQPKW